MSDYSDQAIVSVRIQRDNDAVGAFGHGPFKDFSQIPRW
jgi:hypothetical protein